MPQVFASARALILILTLGTAGDAGALPEELDVFTNFEFPSTDVGDPITLGTSPGTATLAGDAFAGKVGQLALYHSGSRAWMVTAGGTGTIAFETNAGRIEFWALANPNASGTTVITAFDDLDAVIGNAVTLIPGEDWLLVSFSGSIDRIDVINNDGSQLNGIDDFGFTPIPEPGTSAMLSLGLLALAARAGRMRA